MKTTDEQQEERGREKNQKQGMGGESNQAMVNVEEEKDVGAQGERRPSSAQNESGSKESTSREETDEDSVRPMRGEVEEQKEGARGTESIETRQVQTTKLTDRDRDMLGLLVVARYLTAQQVHRLAFDGRNISAAYRRLLKLSRNDGQVPFVRQRFFRTYDGNRVAVWAPTAHGVMAASVRAGGLPELPKHDVGAQFLEHLIQLNELLIALWRTGNGRCARVAHPSYRWVPSDCVRLSWGEYEILEGRRQLRMSMSTIIDGMDGGT